MKPQDMIFAVSLLCILLARRPRILVYAGLGAICLSIPLFSRWIFFTAERLTWYAAGFFAVYLAILLLRPHTVQ